jgi:hypothetical protein
MARGSATEVSRDTCWSCWESCCCPPCGQTAHSIPFHGLSKPALLATVIAPFRSAWQASSAHSSRRQTRLILPEKGPAASEERAFTEHGPGQLTQRGPPGRLSFHMPPVDTIPEPVCSRLAIMAVGHPERPLDSETPSRRPSTREQHAPGMARSSHITPLVKASGRVFGRLR